MDENRIGDQVIATAIGIHRGLGPGLLERVYEVVLARELSKRNLLVERQVSIPIVYEGDTFEEGFKADILIERKVILELKSTERITDLQRSLRAPREALFALD